MEATVGLVGDYVYLGGEIGDVLVALLGSPQHILGHRPPKEKVESRGFYAYLEPHVLSSLRKYMDDNAKDVPAKLEEEISQFGIGYFISWINGDVREKSGIVKIRFLAQRIVVGAVQAQSPMTLIGTPLYVAVD
jgi:hypothetical protein